MKLFTYTNFEVKISEEAMTIRAFKDLVRRDRKRDKSTAILELSFIYFFVDPRSDYAYITNEEDRMSRIVEQIGLPNTWSLDDKVREAIKVYAELTETTATKLLGDTRVAIDKIREFLRDIDLNATDDKDKPKYTINSVVSAVKEIPRLTKELIEVEKIVTNEIEENGKMRANKQKTISEDGFDIWK